MSNAAGQKPKLPQGWMADLWRWWNKEDKLNQCESTANSFGFHDDSLKREKIIDLMSEAGYEFTSKGVRGDHLNKSCYSSRYVREKTQ